MNEKLLQEKVTDMVKKILDTTEDFELVLLDETVTGFLLREKAKQENKEGLIPAFSREDEQHEKEKLSFFSSLVSDKDIDYAMRIPLAFLPAKLNQIEQNIGELSVRLQDYKKSLELIREEYPSSFLFTEADSSWKKGEEEASTSWYDEIIPKANYSQDYPFWRRHPALEQTPASPKPSDFYSILDCKLYWMEETVSYLLEGVVIAKIRLQERREEFNTLSAEK